MSAESKALIEALDQYINRYIALRYPRATATEHRPSANPQDVIDARAVLAETLDQFHSFAPIMHEGQEWPGLGEREVKM